MPGPLLVDALALPRYDLGVDHPFANFRQEPLFDLLTAHGLVQGGERFVPPAATDPELATVHATDYVAFLRALDASPSPALLRHAPLFGMGTADNPIAPGQHAAAAAAAGGTLACMRAVLRGEASAAFNPTGGLHHAMPGSASGFCLYNDLALAIAEALSQGIERVAYIDFDVHHGDGVEWIFREDPRVLTVSLHETPDRRWPFTGRVRDQGRGRGEGSALNIPFASRTGDASWQSIARAVLEPAFERFRPQVLITQHGCDPHFSDPLADLCLTTASFDFAAKISRELAARHCDGRWVATGGGGYQPIRVIPRAWTMTWCAVADRAVPQQIDSSWRGRWLERADGDLPATFLDREQDFAGSEAAAIANAAMLEELRSTHPLLR
ncbi:MAG: acetoin utilization protein AcuC [Planctomycetota bacterium]